MLFRGGFIFIHENDLPDHVLSTPTAKKVVVLSRNTFHNLRKTRSVNENCWSGSMFDKYNHSISPPKLLANPCRPGTSNIYNSHESIVPLGNFVGMMQVFQNFSIFWSITSIFNFFMTDRWGIPDDDFISVFHFHEQKKKAICSLETGIYILSWQYFNLSQSNY